MLRVDDRWHGKDLLCRVVNDRVYWRIANDVEVSRQVLVGLCHKYAKVDSAQARAKPMCDGQTHLEELHHFICSVLRVLVQRCEFNVLRRSSLVGDLSFTA